VIGIDLPATQAALDEASARLVETASTLDDTSIGEPCALPGWNRAMLVTHLARNAQGFAGMFRGAQRGEVVHLYPHGRPGRNADIDAGRDRSAAEVLADLVAAVDEYASVSAELTEAEWERAGTTFDGDKPVWTTLPVRRREVEVHHVDLALGYHAGDWPSDFVAVELALAVEGLPPRLPAGTALQLVTTDGLGQWTVTAAQPGGAGAAGDTRGGAGAAGDAHPTAAPAPGQAGDRGLARVEGPGHEVLAWLLGRTSAVRGGPELGPW